MSIYNCNEIENILNQYGDMIYRMAFVQVKNRSIADDVYQEVCIKLIKQKHRIEPEEPPIDVYEYAEGKKAYFVEDQEYEDIQKVYFSENNILFQLFVDKSDTGTVVAKVIIDCMAK